MKHKPFFQLLWFQVSGPEKKREQRKMRLEIFSTCSAQKHCFSYCELYELCEPVSRQAIHLGNSLFRSNASMHLLETHYKGRSTDSTDEKKEKKGEAGLEPWTSWSWVVCSTAVPQPLPHPKKNIFVIICVSYENSIRPQKKDFYLECCVELKLKRRRRQR